MEKEERIKLIFIAGLGRNGGTLIDRILGHVPGVFSLGEFRFVWQKGVLNNELCSCGRPFRECEFWQEVFAVSFGGFDEEFARRMEWLSRHTSRTRYLPLLLSRRKPHSFNERVQEYVSMLRKLYASIVMVSQSNVLVDSSKFAGYGLLLSLIPNLSLHVVHLVRDVRASAFSWQKKVLKPEVLQKESYMRRYSPWQTALMWMYRNTSAEMLKKYADTYVRVRYEDFVSQPRAFVKNVLDTVGIAWDGTPFLGSHVVKIGTTHTQSGNPVRFKKGVITIRYDEEWKHKLSRKQRWITTGISFPLLLRYGYPLWV